MGEVIDPISLPKVKCPWCGEEVSQRKYSDHLEEEHYKIEGEKKKGPYPAGVPE